MTNEEFQKTILNRFDGIDKRFDRIDNYLEENETFKQFVVKQFTGINKRLDVIDTGLDRVNARLDAIDMRLDRVDTRLDRVNARLDKVETRLDKVDEYLVNATPAIKSNIERLTQNQESIIEALKEVVPIKYDKEKQLVELD